MMMMMMMMIITIIIIIINHNPAAVVTTANLVNKRTLGRDLFPKKAYFHQLFNPVTPKDPYSGRTAPLTSKRCILYIYSTNTGTENFKHGVYCPFLSIKNAVCFIILTYLVTFLFTFYIQSVLKFKKK